MPFGRPDGLSAKVLGRHLDSEKDTDSDAEFLFIGAQRRASAALAAAASSAAFAAS